MDRRVLLVIIAVLAAIVLAAFSFTTRDIRAQVSRTESSVLAALESEGVTDKDLLSREESEWTGGRTLGKKIRYVFRAGRDLRVSDLSGRIKKSLDAFKGVRLSKIYYEGAPGSRGVVRFDVTFRNKVVISLVFNSVLPTWVKDAAGYGGIRGAAPAPPGEKAMIALVLDDFGYTKKNFEALKSLGIPVTMAVLPNTPYSGAACDFARKNGMEIILHLPMEPENVSEGLEKDTITGDMSAAEIRSIITDAFRSVPGARGLSNHMGSGATKSERVMEIVIGDLKERDLFFLDSLTTRASAGKRVAERMDVPCATREIFIDNKMDREYIAGQLDTLRKMALARGSIVAIGHDRALTIDVLREEVPEMESKGIRFVPLSHLIEDKVRRAER